MDSVLVDEIPWDVDRDQKYRIECEEEDYIDKAKDGRWFEMHTSSRKGLVGKRKVGTCQGSLMCENTNCPKLLSEGIPIQMNLQRTVVLMFANAVATMFIMHIVVLSK